MYLEIKAVSAGTGPSISIPNFFRDCMAGSIMFISSFPKMPSSPAWGFRPHTSIFGFLSPNLLIKS